MQLSFIGWMLRERPEGVAGYGTEKARSDAR